MVIIIIKLIKIVVKVNTVSPNFKKDTNSNRVKI